MSKSLILFSVDGGEGSGGAGAFGEMDMSEADPELAMALRISLEEQRARQVQVYTRKVLAEMITRYRVQNILIHKLRT